MSSPADQPGPGIVHDPAVSGRVKQLYESHARLVRSVCRSLLRDREEAEDAVQQTFLSAQRALLNGSSPREPAAWLATIARHESLARVRARMREPLSVEIEEYEPAAPDAHAGAVQRHEAGELRDALAQLPLQQREAILLRELRGLSYQEVAATLSITTSAVESLLFRARRSLQTRLQGALAALSPACWLQSVRDLAGGLGSGGLAAPAASKVAAVGLGTALFAGGAVGPTVLGLGHAPSSGRRAAQPAAQRVVRAAPRKASLPLWRVSATVRPQQVHVRTPGGSHQSEASDAGRSSDGERERSTVASVQHDDGSEAGASGSTSGSTRSPSSEKEDGTGDSRSGTTTTGTTTSGTTTSGTTTTGTTTTSTDPVTTND